MAVKVTARDEDGNILGQHVRQDDGSIVECSFSERNRKRCESPNGFNHLLGDWSLSEWCIATVGELGEAANIVKKLIS